MDTGSNSEVFAGSLAAPTAEGIAPATIAHEGDVVPNLPPAENKKFYPALDGLRGVAVLMVFFQHYFSHPLAAKWGWAGVNIFFVLSGFLITGILYDTRNTRHRFRNFYVRRTLRIFPLYYGVLVGAMLAWPVLHWVWHPAWFFWPLYLGNYSRFIWINTWVTNGPSIDHLVAGVPGAWPSMLYFGHFWSLCVEEQFYLAWPLVVFLVKDRIKLRKICVAAFFCCLAGRVVCQNVLPDTLIGAGFLERFTLLRVDSLLLGGFVALTLRGPEFPRLRRLALPVMLWMIGLFAGMEGYYLATTRHLFYFQPEPWLQTVGLSVIDVFAGCLILFTIDPTTFAFRLLNWRWLRSLGQISYGFYVFHDIPHLVYGHVGSLLVSPADRLFAPVTAAVALVCTLLLSYLSFRFYEAPFLRLKERFTV